MGSKSAKILHQKWWFLRKRVVTEISYFRAVFYEQKLMFWNFKNVGDIFWCSWHEKKLENFLLFSRYCTIFSIFSKIGHRGYVLGPKNLFSSMLVSCAFITTCLQKTYFGAPPGPINYIFGDVVFLYPMEAPRGCHRQMPKMCMIFFCTTRNHFYLPFGY